MTAKEFNTCFIKCIAADLDQYTQSGTLDVPAIREHYNLLTDQKERCGEITEKQRFNWCTPAGALSIKHLKKIKAQF